MFGIEDGVEEGDREARSDTIPCHIEGCEEEGHIAPADYESEGRFISKNRIFVGEGEFHCACMNCLTDFRGFSTQDLCGSFWDHHLKRCAPLLERERKMDPVEQMQSLRDLKGEELEVRITELDALKVQLALETSRADEADQKHRNMCTLYTASEARNRMLEQMIRSVLE